MNNELANYFGGDMMAVDAWKDKYCLKDTQLNPVENTPADMHRRMAKEFARIEWSYRDRELHSVQDHTTQYPDTFFTYIDKLSEFGQKLLQRRLVQSEEQIAEEIFSYFDKFTRIVPQGSVMSNLGNIFVFGSLSNCFTISSPEDSYGGILRADEELVQLMKRRGGVGTSLDNLRPVLAKVSNAARSSTGVPSFAERYSNSTREVAQEGRRGALMLLLHVAHPDIFKFVGMKDDRTKVTGANISVKFTDKFLKAVEADDDFYCAFPIKYSDAIHESIPFGDPPPYNVVADLILPNGTNGYVMRIKAAELFDEFVNMAWSNAEPGAAYIDRIIDYSPDGVYDMFKPVSCNPCGEIWMGDYDACRLIAQNLFSIVDDPFSQEAMIDYVKLYEVSYMQQRFSDDLVDLEIEHISRIIDKLKKDPEPLNVRMREIELWEKIRAITKAGRRTGNGFTALADMLAALNIPYGKRGIATIAAVMKVKMQAELDATIDMAITRGTFEGWNRYKEFNYEGVADPSTVDALIPLYLQGLNSFYVMLKHEFPEQAIRMFKYGRRNVSWSTVAPTGTVSLMTQTTSGLEPLFKAYYIRRKKINPGQEGVRVDFVDQNGDNWQEYAILHPKFKQWIERTHAIDGDINQASKQAIQNAFDSSPWKGSEADDISYEDRVAIQAVIQRYTSNSISSTINLPKDVSKETVRQIYLRSWKAGLKGVTIYRDGSRSGVLITEPTITKTDTFGYNDAIKRPTSLPADYYCVTTRGKKFAVIIGKLNDKPYEVFAFEDPICETILTGEIVKRKRGEYAFLSPNYDIDNLQLTSEHSDEKLLTRWVSLLLRHGANPKFIAEQVEKSEVTITSFAKVIARVLKKYIPDENLGEACPVCGQNTVIREEGCKKCTSCGNSKC